MAMLATMALITSTDTVWLASPSHFRYFRMGRPFMFLFRWDKEKSKLALAAELVRQAMKAIGMERQVILLCDN